MVKGIHHINFLVRDLDSAIPRFENILDRKVDGRDHLDERGVDLARFRVGETWLLLVEPVKEGTVPWEHLQQHGEGFFLLSLEVDDLIGETRRLGDAAFSSPPRHGLDDWLVADLVPELTGGAQFHLTQPGGVPAES